MQLLHGHAGGAACLICSDAHEAAAPPLPPAQVPAIFGAHPLVILYCKFDETIGALIGHDGFGWPATVRSIYGRHRLRSVMSPPLRPLCRARMTTGCTTTSSPVRRQSSTQCSC